MGAQECEPDGKIWIYQILARMKICSIEKGSWCQMHIIQIWRESSTKFICNKHLYATFYWAVIPSLDVTFETRSDPYTRFNDSEQLHVAATSASGCSIGQTLQLFCFCFGGEQFRYSLHTKRKAKRHIIQVWREPDSKFLSG